MIKDWRSLPKPLLHHRIFMRAGCCVQIICEMILLTLDSPEMIVSGLFFLFLDHPQVLIRLWIKANICIHGPLKSEPTLPLVEHSRTDVGAIFSDVGGSHSCVEMWLCVHLPPFPYPSTTIFTSFQMEQVYTSSSLFYAPTIIWDAPQPLDK